MRPLSRREMARHQAARGKPEAVDVAPPDAPRPVTDPLTGDVRMVPAGISEGWDHQPGNGWERGLVPPELLDPLEPVPVTSVAPAAPMPSIATIAKPLAIPLGQPGRPPLDYIDDFLAAFGARRGSGGAVLFRDVAGHVVPVSEDLFMDGAGNLKTTKYDPRRELTLPRLAETLRDPDEVWVAWSQPKGQARPRLVRRYLRYDPLESGLGSFAYAQGFGWSGATIFPPQIGGEAAPERGITSTDSASAPCCTGARNEAERAVAPSAPAVVHCIPGPQGLRRTDGK